jgi:hypothetical protein
MMLAGVFFLSSTLGLTTAGAAVGGPSGQPAQVALGSASSFAVLAGTTVTNTGPSAITGNLGVSPGTAVTGFPPGTVADGAIHAGDAVAAAAETDLTTAYNDAAGRAPDQNLTGQDLGGQTLTAGVYMFDSSAGLTGTLTLDGQGNPNAVFIFQIGSTLTTASASNVVFTNGARACNVFWQVGSSATLGTTTSFAGNILALTSITATTGVSVDGRLLALNGAVTLDTNAVHKADCGQGPSGHIEICKHAGSPGVKGTFTFTFGSHTVHVPVGACSPLISVPSGQATITELRRAPDYLASCRTVPSSRLISCDRSTQTATVTVKPGSTARQTVVIITNRVPVGEIKVCKVAGAGVRVGTRIHFTVNGHAITVPAGPAPGGYCVVVGRFPLGTQATIIEQIPAAEHVSAITASPAKRLVSADLTTGTAVVDVGKGFIDVTFTDTSTGTSS